MMHFCMAFWTDGEAYSTRERNVKLTWPYLKDMVEYFNQKGVPASAKLFDYSPEKIIDGAIHIPYPLGTYKRSEKLNNIVNSLPEEDNVSLIDCDIFIHRSQWDALIQHVLQVKYDVGFFYNFAKVEYMNGTPLDALDPTAPHPTAYSKGYCGGFGGLQLSSIKVIKDLGGYDEKFTTWGGEDGDLMDRYLKAKFHRIGVSEDDVLPLHLPHFEDRENILYFNREEYVRNNNLTV